MSDELDYMDYLAGCALALKCLHLADGPCVDAECTICKMIKDVAQVFTPEKNPDKQLAEANRLADSYKAMLESSEINLKEANRKLGILDKALEAIENNPECRYEDGSIRDICLRKSYELAAYTEAYRECAELARKAREDCK